MYSTSTITRNILSNIHSTLSTSTSHRWSRFGRSRATRVRGARCGRTTSSTARRPAPTAASRSATRPDIRGPLKSLTMRRDACFMIFIRMLLIRSCSPLLSLPARSPCLIIPPPLHPVHTSLCLLSRLVYLSHRYNSRRRIRSTIIAMVSSAPYLRLWTFASATRLSFTCSVSPPTRSPLSQSPARRNPAIGRGVRRRDCFVRCTRTLLNQSMVLVVTIVPMPSSACASALPQIYGSSAFASVS